MANLLVNGDFNFIGPNGFPYYNIAGQTALDIPYNWEIVCLDKGYIMHYAPKTAEVIGTYNKYGPRARANMAQCLKPEVKTIGRVAPYLDPPRIPDGCQHTVYGFKWSGTLYWCLIQTVKTTPGKKYRLTSQAHAWCHAPEDPDGAYYSHGIGRGAFYHDDSLPMPTGFLPDDVLNYRFRLGADPFGHSNPLGSAVVWAPTAAYIYNVFHSIPAVEFVARADTSTVIVEVGNLWGWQNSDAAIGPVVLEEVPEQAYVICAHLLPQDATLVESLHVMGVAHPLKQSVVFSADDVKALVMRGLTGSKVIVWDKQRWTAGDIIAWLRPCATEERTLPKVDGEPAKLGLQLRPTGPVRESDYQCIAIAGNVTHVKLTIETPPETIDRLKALGISPDNIVVLLKADLSSEAVTAEQFAGWMVAPIKVFMGRGVKRFEVHNEPNMSQFGLGISWKDAPGFVDWYTQVVTILRRECPGILVGFPGLSPNPNVTDWLLACSGAIRSSDWVGIHCYWTSDGLMFAEEHGGYFWRYVRAFPGKELNITEFSNPNPAEDKAVKGAQYKAWWQALPKGKIRAAYCFISSCDGFPYEAWVDELEHISAIPYIIGGETPPPPTAGYEKPQSMGGVHISFGGRTGYHEFLVGCGRSIFVKSYEDFGALMEAKEVNPDTVTVIRVRPGGIDEDTPGGNWQWDLADTQRIAQDWMRRCFAKLELNNPAYFDYVEVMNEPDPADAAAMDRATAFVQACMELADAHNPPYKLAIWAWTAGLPRTPRLRAGEFDQMERTLGTLKYAAEHGHAYAVHEGSVNDERRLFQQAAVDKTALRYRITAQMMAEKGWKMPPIVITEAYQVDGYNHPDWNDWKWYLTELAKDPYVLGCAWFTLGDWEFGGGQNVNIVGQLGGFAATIRSLPIIGG